MNYIYITGTSKGIGKAIAEELLEHDCKVIGVSRHQTIEHENYLHIELDLAKVPNIKKFRFEKLENASKIVLINNAGVLGDIKYMGSMNDAITINGWILNLIAPGILINQFIKEYKSVEAEKLILNISSGAAVNPVDGWSLYCSSKAGLDMITKVVNLEQQKINGNLKIFSIAPGIVDTAMQDKIRDMKEEDFSRVEEFRNYKEKNELKDPKQVARKIREMIIDPSQYTDPVVRFNY